MNSLWANEIFPKWKSDVLVAMHFVVNFLTKLRGKIDFREGKLIAIRIRVCVCVFLIFFFLHI